MRHDTPLYVIHLVTVDKNWEIPIFIKNKNGPVTYTYRHHSYAPKQKKNMDFLKKCLKCQKNFTNVYI